MTQSRAESKRAADRAYYERHRERILARVHAYNEQHRDAIRARKRKYYQKHREKVRAAVRTYAALNKDTVLARARASHRAHRPQRLARQRVYRQENLETVRAKNREWGRQDRKRHPEKSVAGFHVRQARQRGAFVEKVSLLVLYRRDRRRCGLCGKPVPRREASIDHIVPLSRGGEHSYRNTHLAHLQCNRMKGNRAGGQLRLIG